MDENDWIFDKKIVLDAGDSTNVKAGMIISARKLRDEFFPKETLLSGEVVGLNAIVKDAVVLGYLRKPLSRRQLSELVQIAAPPAEDGMSGEDATRICALLLLGP